MIRTLSISHRTPVIVFRRWLIIGQLALFVASTGLPSAIASSDGSVVTEQPLGDGLQQSSLNEPAIEFRRFGPEHGLSHNTVNAILQTHDGLLWLATDDGVDRWDGYDVRSFRLPPDAGSNIAMCLLEDTRGVVWVGMRTGLHRLDPKRSALVPVPLPWAPGGDQDTEVRDLFEDAHGRLWVAAGGSLFRNTVGAESFEVIPLSSAGDASKPNDLVIAVAEDPTGTMWVLTGPRPWEQTAVYRLDGGGAIKHFPVPDAGPGGRAFRIDDQGQLWSAAARGRFAAPELYPAPVPALGEEGMVNAIVYSESGVVWVGTDKGLRRYDPVNGQVQSVPLRSEAPSWQQGWVVGMLEDRAGSLWVGTLGGLFVFDPAAKPFHHLGHEPGLPTSLSTDPVSALAEGSDGELWVGTFGGGLNRVDLVHQRTERFRHRPGDSRSLCGDTIWDLELAVDGRLWTATDGGLCARQTDGHFLTAVWNRPADAPPLPVVRQVLELPDGDLWVGVMNEGALRFDPVTGRGQYFEESYWTGIISKLIRESGAMWFGRDTSPALLRFDPGTETVQPVELRGPHGQIMRNLNVFGQYEARNGDFWLATASGLRRFEPVSGSLSISVTRAIPGSIAYSILEDGRGQLWVGTNRGLARVDLAESPPAVQLFDLGDGIGNLEFNRGAALLTRDGKMVFGGMSGLTYFTPEHIRRNTYEPPLVLNAIHTLGDDGERYIEPFGLNTLTVQPDQHAVTFEFAALSYTRPEKNRYSYRLEGLDRSWIDSGTRRFARYTNLPPGNYRFHIKGSNDDNLWNETGLSLPVVVLPAVWQTWWFATGIVLLVLAIAGYLVRMRVRRLVELERLRLRIATDLHDELGSELSGISLASALLEESEELADSTRRTLGEIRSSAGHLLPRMRDIVWLIDPEKDRLGPLALRLQSIAETLTAGVSLEFSSNAFEHKSGLPMAQRRDLLLLFRELLTNVARHANATRVEVRFDVIDRQIELEVVDNGHGFEQGRNYDGTGLRNVNQRAEQLGAEFTLDSQPGRGTQALLRLSMRRK